MRKLEAVVVGSLLFASACLIVAAAEPGQLGQIFFGDAGDSQMLDPVGRPVADRELVRTVDHWAIVRLDNRQVLRLDVNSAATLRAASPGSVRIDVLAGRLTVVGRKGRLLGAGAGSTFTLGPAQTDPLAAERLLVDEASSARNPRSRADGRWRASRGEAGTGAR